MKTKIQKNSKPVSHDTSLEYMCDNCRNTHWIFLREAQVKNYKIVCECNNIIIPSLVSTIYIEYLDSNIDNKIENSQVNEPPLDIMSSCGKILESYGYSVEESKNMICKSFQATNSKTIKDIIEYALKNFGVNNEQ